MKRISNIHSQSVKNYCAELHFLLLKFKDYSRRSLLNQKNIKFF